MMAKATVAVIDGFSNWSGQGADGRFSLDSKTHPFEKWGRINKQPARRSSVA
jgi:hypothetical protein